MKKTTILLSLILVLFKGFTQSDKTWYNLAVKGGFGNSIFFTSNYSGDANVQYNYFTPSYFWGFDGGVVFAGGFGLGLEYSFQKGGQEYEINGIGGKYTKVLQVYTDDVLFLIRAFDEGFGFFEIGPKLSMVKKINDANSNNGNLIANTIDNYSDKYISIMFGFGIPAYQGDLFDFTIGLRAGYSIMNIMKDEEYPINDLFFNKVTANYPSYSTTNPFFAQITFRFDWHIGIKGSKNKWD
ncbi:MAG: hypothetical protein JXR58_03020 [Bacteroidales bacterium]|nr:hypothetical protein [Bacteroidales bacterium]